MPRQPHARLCRLPAKESHGSASQESPTPLPDGGFISVWHFGLTQSKTRALNSPEVHLAPCTIPVRGFLHPGGGAKGLTMAKSAIELQRTVNEIRRHQDDTLAAASRASNAGAMIRLLKRALQTETEFHDSTFRLPGCKAITASSDSMTVAFDQGLLRSINAVHT